MSTTPVENGTWIPLMDYAMKNGVSLSTLRRYIKAGKIAYKSEHGKYFIFSTTEAPRTAEAEWMRASTDAKPALEPRVEKLEVELKRAQEEISELKMLVAIYEERLFQNLPPQL
jgi:predicted site-specific integrase-resolvase